MPDNYAVAIEDPETRQPTWIEYLGSNHRRLTVESMSDKFEVLDHKGSLELRRSGHGAVIVDTGRGVYAWAYVFPGGRKLRWPSVTTGVFDGSAIILTIAQPEPGEDFARLRVDLASGSLTRDSR